jgi:hypothetical protein
MLERNRLVTAEVERLLAATKGSRNAARCIRPNPAPPHHRTTAPHAAAVYAWFVAANCRETAP